MHVWAWIFSVLRVWLLPPYEANLTMEDFEDALTFLESVQSTCPQILSVLTTKQLKILDEDPK